MRWLAQVLVLSVTVAVALCIWFPSERVAAQSCDACADTAASISGTILLDGLTVSVKWETDEENASNGFYRVLRYPCASRSCTPVAVSLLGEQGSCYLRSHDIRDEPPPGEWWYSVKLFTPSNVERCRADAPGSYVIE